MAEDAAPHLPVALHVDYHPITGVPAEFNEYLPKDCDEFKRWKTAQEAGTSGVEGGIQDLKLKDKQGEEIVKKLPGGKVKKKQKAEVVVERNTRNKRKCITTVSGLELFGVKLPEAAKLFGKKFACGASVTKSPSEKDQIDVQGDVQDQIIEFIMKTYGAKNKIGKPDVYIIDEKRKVAYYDAGDDDDDEE